MEITTELLEKIYERVEQVFFTKMGYKPDNTEMHNGSFYCYKSFNISYGCTEVIDLYISAEDLNTDLDELIKQRKIKEEVERIENERRQKENTARYEREQKAKRLAEFNKLKKEFEG